MPMTRASKYFLIAFFVVIAALVSVGIIYQRHLRFLLTDYSTAKPPAVQIAFPVPGIKPLKNALILDGIQLPFSEAEIANLQTFDRNPSIIVKLTSGVDILLHVPLKYSSKLENLLEEMSWELSSRNSFRWTMTSQEVEDLHDRIMAKESGLDVAQIGLRKEKTWNALLQIFPRQKLTQIEWITSDETQGGVIQFNFSKSPSLSNDPAKQLEFNTRFEIISTPKGTFEEELKALIERVRAKDPAAVKESSTAK